MKEAFEKIIERVCEFIHERNKSGSTPCKNQRASCFQLIRVCDLTAIVNQVAEEYGNDGWIPCSERLPEIDGSTSETVLVCSADGFQNMAFWCSDNKWRFCESGMIRESMDWAEILAWQPLPAPYKGGIIMECNKKKYKIELICAEDVTYFDMSLSDEEYKLLLELSKLSHEASYTQCMPIMSVKPKDEEK